MKNHLLKILIFCNLQLIAADGDNTVIKTTKDYQSNAENSIDKKRRSRRKKQRNIKRPINKKHVHKRNPIKDIKPGYKKNQKSE